MNKPTNTSQDLLNEALREASGEAAQAHASSPSTTGTSHKLSIEEALLDQHSTPSPSVARTHATSHSAVRRPVDSSIDAALSKVGAGDTALSSKTSSVTAESPTRIADSLADTLSGIGAPMPERDSVSASQASKTTLRRLSGFGLLVIALIAAGSFWWSQQQQQPTGAAAVLLELNSAVEQHKSKHSGQLPVTLGTLPAFPKGAVEWPFRYWNARDAAGRTEIIWIPRGKNYSILLRQDKETWIVSDRAPKPKLITTGKP